MPYIPGSKFPYEGWPLKGFEPGTFGCHEALHLASTFMIMVEEHLAEHPAVRANPEWDALATTAVTALADLYHAIRKVHLAARQSSQTSEDQPPG
jgi:phosphopantothenate synthetase